MEQLLKTWKLRMVKYRQEADNANTPITRVKEMNKFFILRDCIKELEEQLTLTDVVKSLPIQDLPNCTRVEVIDQKGRSYVNWKPTNKVRLSMQDDGRTAKIFID